MKYLKAQSISKRTGRIVLSILSLVLLSKQVAAQPNEAAILQAMRNLGQLWQNLALSSKVLVLSCPGNTYKGIRLKPGAQVSIDLQKTNSVMSPYLGIVRITGEFQINSSEVDGSCDDAAEAAVKNSNWWGNNQNYNYELYYQLSGNDLIFAQGNEVFNNGFLRQGVRPLYKNNDHWRKAFRFPLAPPRP